MRKYFSSFETLHEVGYVVAVILIIAVVIAIACAWTKKKASTFSDRLLALEQEIENQLRALHFAKTLKLCLDRKIKILLRAMKVFFCSFILLTWILLVADGQDLMSSVFDAFDLLGILYISLSYLFLNRFMEPNKLLTIIEKHLQLWVYKGSNFESNRIKEIELQINLKRRGAEEIRNKMTFG